MLFDTNDPATSLQNHVHTRPHQLAFLTPGMFPSSAFIRKQYYKPRQPLAHRLVGLAHARCALLPLPFENACQEHPVPSHLLYIDF